MQKKIYLIIILISQIVSSQTGIETQEPKASLDINGDLIVRKTPLSTDSNVKPVFINQDGLLVVKDDIKVSSPIFFAVTSRDVYASSAENAKIFNEAKPFYIPFEEKDVLINNLNIKADKNSFRIGKEGTYQISGTLGFMIGSAKSGDLVYVSIRLEKSTDNGSTWETLIGIRPVFPIYWNSGQGVNFIIPTVISVLKKDDLVRFVFNRTAAGSTLQGENITSLGVRDINSSKAYTLSIVKL